jgi:thymidylate synthase (FAD)
MGSDLRIVNAAQSSFNRESEEYGERERRILRALMREEHGVPFEHVVFTYRLRLPLFLAAQFKKHRMGSWSEHSARYSEMEELTYVPEEVRKQVGKAMEYRYEDATDWESAWFQQEVRKANAAAFRAYNDALAVGIAKEQARVVLPVNTYTTVTWTLNARALFNFLRLRLDSHAQSEAYEYAQQMEELAAGVIPDTVRAFIDAGRPKP